jgi:mono/diheme cytochrome c family protein
MGARMSFSSEATMEADASRGRAILEARHCLDCHTLDGSGNGTAPDLARRSVTRQHTPSELAALMWNHGPEMWRVMASRSLEIGPLSPSEADDLFAYFWSLRYFDPRGEAGRGKQLFVNKQCASCHALTSTNEPRHAPAVSEWTGVKNAVVWAQQLWNHGAAMERAMVQRGMTWPTFSEQEMVDLLVYVQNLPTAHDDPFRLAMSSSTSGPAVFAAKRCATCHTIDARDPTKSSLGGELRDFGTLSGFTAAMWNHAHELRTARSEGEADPVTFSTGEMRDLVSYLYVNGGFEEYGDADAGRKVFADAGCQTCHGADAAADGAAAPLNGPMSAARMASAVWSHGPQMLENMERRGLTWPTLSSRQLANLVAFLDGGRPSPARH